MTTDRASRMRDLHPGWFAAVMGTGIVAVASDANPGGLTALQPAAHAVGVAFAVLTSGREAGPQGLRGAAPATPA